MDLSAEAAAVGIEYAPLAAVSLSGDPVSVAHNLVEACSTAGFFYLTDSGVPKEDIEEMYSLARQAQQLPHSEHLRFKTSAATDGNYSGFVGSDTDDSVTSYYNMAKPGSGFEKPLPDLLAAQREKLDAFQAKCQDVGDRILRLLSIGLELPGDYFVAMHGRRTVSGSHLRLMWYPARGLEQDAETGGVRIQGHSDFGSLTIMFAPEVVALQVLDNTDQKTWRYVKPVPGALICNIGDTLQFISGGLLKSTVHRVTRPPLPSQQNMHRFNLLYFLRADDSVVLRPPPSRYIPASAAKIEGMGMTAGEWVLARVKAAVRRRGYDGKNQDAEAKEEYNRLQRISNSVVGREIEDSFQVGEKL